MLNIPSFLISSPSLKFTMLKIIVTPPRAFYVLDSIQFIYHTKKKNIPSKKKKMERLQITANHWTIGKCFRQVNYSGSVADPGFLKGG